ncbi:MAG: hypothetical protein KME15_09145 [Drouetiella hepatica Uher 2000/2452]|uniref:Phytanoyl-CoA dioxygenase n=1 Tax=Drouetiella hepatica Uher 2000/2452 TaxID=904376 RepID=A0A951QA56_9CYAN|nr:hypothetical protein [Drouetiella hepatica Uher 2000/2452]
MFKLFKLQSFFLQNPAPNSKNMNVLAALNDSYDWWSKRISSLPAKAIWNISKSAFVERNILYPRYQKYIQQHKNRLPKLSAADTAIVEDIRQTGIHVSSLKALNIPHTEEFLAASEAVFQALAERAALPEHGSKHEVLANTAQLLQHEEIFQWGLSGKLLNIVENYLQLPVGYDGLQLVRSHADGREIGVRTWHKDREDRRMLKVCVYLNDVQMEGGPFECLQPMVNTPIYGLFQYQYKLLSDKELKSLLPGTEAEGIRTLVGSMGTVIFVDTALYYHRGKPPTQHHRTAVFFSYFSRRPRNPYFCQRSHLSRSDLDYLARNASAEERDCVYWFDQLPWLAKQMPKSQN